MDDRTPESGGRAGTGPTPGGRPPLSGPALLPFAPLVYVAWADGVLTREELAGLRRMIRTRPDLGDAARAALAAWLDPDAPPGPVEIEALLRSIRESGRRLPAAGRRGLARLGVELGIAAGDREPTSPRAPAEALAAMEEALGVVGAEAARQILPLEPAAPPAVPPAAFDVPAMHRLLDGDVLETRRAVFRLLGEPRFRRDPGWDMATYRARVWEWCQELAGLGLSAPAFPREVGGEADIAKSIAIFETLAFHDLSLTVKYGVQVGLFGGSIYHLGTRRHHERYLRDVMTLRLPGCYAMTETGHGSNVRELETTATYDAAQREFVIHTPHDAARKDYIGNAALHGRMATVFAQLVVGEQNHGVHALLVPIRDEGGGPWPGVRIEDCGPKAGLNGVDNGRLWFDRVRVPRENLLDRFASVGPDGAYTSPIASPTRRFFTMLGTLVAGRISIAAAAGSAAKTGLAIAVRYAAARRQFGPAGGPEVPILDYLDVQRRLLPRLAGTYALDYALADLVRRFAAAGAEDARDVEVLAAGHKALSTRHAVRTLEACREICGGQGYLSVNRFADLRADTDVFTTFEGANAVLLQLVAKGLLTDYREEFGELRIWGAVRYLAGQAATAVTALNPVAVRRSDEAHLRDPEFHLAAFRYREQRLLSSAARRLKRRIDDGQDSFAALNECQDHLLALARAHVERAALEAFQTAVAQCADSELAAALRPLCALYALERIEAGRGWFLESGYLEGGKSKAVRAMVNRLCGEVQPSAVALVDAFGIPAAVLAAPIAASGAGEP